MSDNDKVHRAATVAQVQTANLTGSGETAGYIWSFIMGEKRECTDGEWPCEMSTHLAHLESENLRLRSLLADIKKADIDQYTESGKFWFDDEMRNRIHTAI